MPVTLKTAQRRAQVEFIVRPSGDELPYAYAVGNLEVSGENLGCARIYLFNRAAHPAFELLQTAEYIGEDMPPILGNALANLSKKKRIQCIAVVDSVELNKDYRSFQFRNLFLWRLQDIPNFLHVPMYLTFPADIFCSEPDGREAEQTLRHFRKLKYKIDSGGERTYISKVINNPAWHR